MKITRYIIVLIALNAVFPIGLKALIVPQTAKMISLSSSGIAGNIDIGVNPASIVQDTSSISFSSNEWLGGLLGSKVSYTKSIKNSYHYFSFEYLGIDDIELRDEQPSDLPDGYVKSNWIALDYANNIQNKYNIDMGYKFKLNYSKLYTERYYGYSFDFGLKKNINKYIDLGFVVKNVGVEYKGNKSIPIDYMTGFGIAFNYPVEKNYFKGINVFLDGLIQEDLDIIRIGMKINFPYVSLLFGTSYSDGYGDIAYGLSFAYNNFELAIGNLNHENPILGSPASLQFKYHINKIN